MNVAKDDTKVVDKDFMEKQIEYLKGVPKGINTGLSDLDYRWGGLKPGYTYLIASRPAMGKTALALNMVEFMAIKENHKMAYFSLKHSKEQLVKRLLSMESQEDLHAMHMNNLTKERWDNIILAAKQIGNGNLIINDTLGISVEALDKELAKEVMADVDVVIVDYLQLLNTEYEATHKIKEINYICECLKTIAEKYGVAIVVLSQLSRRPEDRDDHRPVISDLNDEDIVNYFANVSFIYRDEYYNYETEHKNIAEIIIERNKFGSTGVVNLVWLPKYQKFSNLNILIKEGNKDEEI